MTCGTSIVGAVRWDALLRLPIERQLHPARSADVDQHRVIGFARQGGRPGVQRNRLAVDAHRVDAVLPAVGEGERARTTAAERDEQLRRAEPLESREVPACDKPGLEVFRLGVARADALNREQVLG